TEKTPSSNEVKVGDESVLSFLKKMSLFLIERMFVLLYNDFIKQNEVRTGEESVFFETDL
ncbi:hypothetical protein, partial [Bacillus pseudomycoides]|uniref:hypothetical protein n=1 Tax=Bacillus pseudomycoides TaxID=64104 RepID=UPI000BF4544B